MNVLVTGAFGRAGSAIIEYLDPQPEYDLTFLDRAQHPDHDAVIASITDKKAIRPAFDGQDAVIHLAASAPQLGTSVPWAEIVEHNILGLHTVLEAAQDANVQTFIFASSNHVVGTLVDPHVPQVYDPAYELMIDHTVPPHPRSPYGVSKVFGEAFGRYHVDHEDAIQQWYSLRLCGVRFAEDDHPYGDAERGVREGRWERDSLEYWTQVAKRKATGTSRRDFAHMIECCLVDDHVDYEPFFVVSDNDARWFDIDHARNTIGYAPRDNLNAWEGPLPDEIPSRVPADMPDWIPR